MKRPYNLSPRRTLADVAEVLFWVAVIAALLVAIVAFAGACK